MSERRENMNITKLKEEFAEGRMDRRDFLRYSTLLGLSAGAAYTFVGKVTGEVFTPAKAQNMPKGGIIRIAMRVHDVSNPHTFSWLDDSNAARTVVEYLTKTGADNVTRPFLVESWEASDDIKTWTLNIRQGIKWHNGRDFTAEDAAWNIRRVLKDETGSSIIGLMKGYMLNEHEDGTTELWDANAIEVVDSHTVRLNLKEAQVAVPEHLFHYPFMILDPDENGAFGVGSNGTGAFDLYEHEVGVRSFSRARSDYWGGGPFVDEVQFYDLGDDPSALLAALQSRQVHGHHNLDISQLESVQAMDFLNVYQATTANTAVLRVQVDREEYADPRIRKAMRLATDTPRALELAFSGQGAPGEHHHVSPVHPDYKELTFMGRDVDAAKALLADAGYPNGVDLGDLACKPDPSWELAAVQVVVEQWKDAGITCNINVLPSAQFWDVWDSAPMGFTSWAHRPLGFMVLGLAYRSGVPWNESHYSNPEFDAILSQAEGTIDIEARRELIGQLETIMQEDGPIVQPLWRAMLGCMDKKVLGYHLHPTQYIFAEELAIES